MDASGQWRMQKRRCTKVFLEYVTQQEHGRRYHTRYTWLQEESFYSAESSLPVNSGILEAWFFELI